MSSLSHRGPHVRFMKDHAPNTAGPYRTVSEMPKIPGSSNATLLVQLDPSRNLPLHRQLYEELRNAILSGLLKPGELIPASRGIAADLKVSRPWTSSRPKGT